MADKPGDETGDSPKEGSPVKTSPTHSQNSLEVEDAAEASEMSDSGWWGSWITAAKSKSAEVYGMVKKDLDELSTAVKSEASHVITSTSSAIGKTLKLDEPESTANTMRKSFSTFLDQVNTVLNPSPDDDDTEAILITDGDTVTLTTLQRDLLTLQRLDATYLVAPEGAALARMAAWLETRPRPLNCTLQKHLQNSLVLQEKIQKLVPSAVSEDDFWERYLFRKALLEDRFAQSNRFGAQEECSDAVVNSLVPDHPPSNQDSPNESPNHRSLSSDDSVRSNYGSSKSRSLMEGFDGTPTGTPDFAEYVDAADGDEATAVDEDVAWDNEDFASNIELSEEQQIKLLQEYEQEMISAKQISNTLSAKKPSADSPNKSTAPQSKGGKGKSSTSKNQQNVKSTKRNVGDSRSKSSDAISSAQQAQPVGKSKVNQSSTALSKNSKGVSKVPSKIDLESKLVEDHFVDESVKSAKTKKHSKSLSEELSGKKMSCVGVADNASSNSDESWEKEFEIDDLRIGDTNP